jgi:spore germination protein YaaH
MDKTVVLNCYPQSAGNSRDFFDVAKLAPLVDQVFIMDYDMEQTANSTANAPLTNGDLGLSDVQSLLQYRKVVPASKLILGIPFYGVDFTTMTGAPGSLALTESPTVETYETIAAGGQTPLWDPGSQTVWTRFRVGSTWHETWFDNPVSVAIKRALAAEFHLGGVGVWALGFEGDATSMLRALDGGSPPYRAAPAAG